MAKMIYHRINVNGKDFPYQEVFHKVTNCSVLVGSSSLEKELINEDGTYKSEYASRIGNRFYCYVDDNMFDTLTYDEFKEYIDNNFD